MEINYRLFYTLQQQFIVLSTALVFIYCAITVLVFVYYSSHLFIYFLFKPDLEQKHTNTFLHFPAQYHKRTQSGVWI